MAKVKTILGTMTIGKAVDPAKMIATSPPITSLNEAKGFLNEFYQFGSNILDTARVYGSGTTEEVLGEIGVSQAEVHTKAFPPFTDANITNQLNDSLKALKRSSVDLYYLHVPDNSHPLEESLRAVNDLYRQGKFRSFGVSNYPAWQVAEIYYICDKNGWVKPTVYQVALKKNITGKQQERRGNKIFIYLILKAFCLFVCLFVCFFKSMQGMYNAITRDVEKELFPCLRKLNIKFYAYNPLAGGFLANIYRFNDDPHAGRFSHETTAGKLYRVRYWKKEAFAALEKVAAACQKHGISTVDASIHWIYNHSELGEGDAVILGASSINQLKINLDAVKTSSKPLPKDVLDAFNEGWRIFKPTSPPYFQAAM